MRDWTHTYGSIEANNLDAEILLERIGRLSSDTTSTWFLFALPQFLAMNLSFVKSFAVAAKRKTLRGFAIDEAYLFTRSGVTYRPEIRFIGKERIEPITGDDKGACLFFLAMTATMSVHNITLFRGVTFPDASR